MKKILPLILLLLTLPSISPASSTVTSTVPMATQLRNIIEALIGAGDFGSWANVLYGTDPSSFPISATLFVPSDEALAHLSLFNPSILPYHVVPQQLSFSTLQKMDIGSRLPTLLPNETILVTNNTHSNFTLDDSPVTCPDMYENGLISVHGIGSVLNFSVYGSTQLPEILVPESSPTSPPMGPKEGGRRPSHAPYVCPEFPVIVSAGCAFFAWKFRWNSLH